MEEEEIRLTSRKTQDDVVKQLVKKRVYFQWVCSPFYTIHLACAFERTPEIEREMKKEGLIGAKSLPQLRPSDERGQSRPP
jgi:hypothetical protein